MRRAEPAASGRKVASVAFGYPPASRDPFLKRPCTERVDAPRPARRPGEAYPPRYGEGGQRSRSGCSGPRMPGSEGMDLWGPVSPCAEWPPVPCDPGGGSVRQAIYETLQWRHASRFYSHSIVLGGLEEMSYTTRLIPLTSLMMRVEIR